MIYFWTSLISSTNWSCKLSVYTIFRKKVSIFPKPGIDSFDNYFSKVEEDESLAKAYGEIADTGEDLDAQIDKALQGGGSGSLTQSDSLAALKAKMGISWYGLELF